MPVQYSYTSTPPMGCTACTEPQCLYSTAISLFPLWAVRPVQSLSACTMVHFTFTSHYLGLRAKFETCCNKDVNKRLTFGRFSTTHVLQHMPVAQQICRSSERLEISTLDLDMNVLYRPCPSQGRVFRCSFVDAERCLLLMSVVCMFVSSNVVDNYGQNQLTK